MPGRPLATGLEWSHVTYDIPLSKKQRKQHESDHHSDPPAVGTDAEKQQVGIPIVKQGHRRLLRGVSGKVAQGEFLGILGASGAGKTTLLNILSARVSKLGEITGDIKYNGAPREPSIWKRTVGYVEQDDAMLPRSTVRETVEYASQLRLPSSEFSKQEKMERVHQTLRMLRLEDCADTRIGNALERGVSGGERKRASIATELVSDVSLLFLDEPTSGLDAYAAENLINNMAQVVKERDLACVMTIHQPAWAIFTKLDRVILLARGGVYYDGPPRDTIPYFDSLGYTVPEGTNPADYFISITENTEESDERSKRVEELISKWNSREARGISASSEATLRGFDPEAVKRQAKIASRWPTSWVHEFQVLFTRAARESLRDKRTLFATSGQTVFLLILIGFAFFRLSDKQSDVIATVGLLFFIPINSSFTVLFPLVTPFPLQRALMKRERASGLYRTSSFYLAKVLFEVPMAIIIRLIFFVLVYFMAGLRLSAGRFFIFIAINCVQILTAVGLGLMIGSMSPTIDIAQVLSPIINVVFLLFGGTFLPNPPPWFIWLKWISPINYAFAALVQNEFKGRKVVCDTTSTTGCYQSGDDVVRAYNSTRFTIAENFGFLFLLSATFMFAGYCFLRWTAGPRLRFR